MEALGINSLDMGLPGAGPRACSDVEHLAREIVSSKLKIKANCAARTLENDIPPIAEISQKTGLPVDFATFIGSSLVRRRIAKWIGDSVREPTENALTD